MAVEVYYWGGFPGHVAIRVDGGSPAGAMYLSRWPGSLLTALVLSFEGKGNQYSEDVAEEGKEASAKVRFTRLDESAVKRAIIRANQWMIYNDFEANCASHVHVCLDAGMKGLAAVAGEATRRGLLGFVLGDTPLAVYHYARALQRLYA